MRFRTLAFIMVGAICMVTLYGCHYYKTGTVVLSADGSIDIAIKLAPDPDCANLSFLKMEPGEVLSLCDLARAEVSKCAKQKDGSRYGAVGITRTYTGKKDKKGKKIYEYGFDPYCNQKEVPRRHG